MNRNLSISFLLAFLVWSELPTAALAADPSALHPRLPANYFQTTPEKPEQAIPYGAWDLVGKLTNYNNRAALKLPRPWRAVVVLYTLESLHNIDGFDGFFTNTKDVLDAAIEEDLAYAGATPYLKVFTEARKVFNDSKMPEEARDKTLGQLDDRYSELEKEKTLSSYLKDFMKAHQALFLQ